MAAGARSALKARRRLERQLGPGGRRDSAAAPATCAADGEASGWLWPRRCCTVTAARLWPYSLRRALGSCSGAGWRPRSEARWALCFPSVPARRVPEEAIQGAGQELQPAGEAGGQRLAAAHRVLLPEPPANHGCGESGAALGLHTLLSWTRLRFRQDPQPPVHEYLGHAFLSARNSRPKCPKLRVSSRKRLPPSLSVSLREKTSAVLRPE